MNRLPTFLLLAALPVLSACSTLKPTDDPQAQISTDQLEGLNRSIYKFNDGADKLIVKPIAKTYDKVVPQPAKKGVSNFFSNLGEPLNIVNNLLQGKWDRTLSSTYRFAVNSTVGVFGLIDVASKLDVEEANEDLGQTLAAWGVGPGPYVMLPFLGPSNLRDTVGFVTSSAVYFPNNQVSDNSSAQSALNVLNIVDIRASLLPTDQIIAKQLDPYTFIKSAYDQRRKNVIYDGSPPETEEEYDF